MANNIRLKIGGIEYSISAEEDEAYIRRIAAELERRMNTVQARSPFLSTTMAAVMTALETLDEAKKAENECEKLRLEIKRLLEETAMAKMDAEISRRMLEQVTAKTTPFSPAAPIVPEQDDEEEDEEEFTEETVREPFDDGTPAEDFDESPFYPMTDGDLPF